MSTDLPLAWRALRENPQLFEELTPAEKVVLAYAHDLWLRPSQRIPRTNAWRYYGHVCGRGWGKSHAIACEVHRRVAAGEATRIALMGPTETRVDEVQANFLVEISPPWFKAERYLGGVKWPNGVRALPFSAEEPQRARGDNFDLAWLNEIVGWDAVTARTAFNNVTTATRKGSAQVLWDTTTTGRNAVVSHLFERHRDNPTRYPIVRGSMFDNPTLPPEYVKDEVAKYVPGSRQYREEVLGEFLDETAGALWQQAWLDRNRVNSEPAFTCRLVAIDPALSARANADETGLVVGGLADGHAYVTHDHSGHLAVEQWGDIAIAECADNGAAGVIVERNHLGDNPAFVLRSRARCRGREVRVLAKDTRAFPARDPRTIWVREVTAVRSKGERARAPASETEAGRVHLVGSFGELEAELTTYEPGQRTSPNRLDAMAWLVTELLGLRRGNSGAAQLYQLAGHPGVKVAAAARAL